MEIFREISTAPRLLLGVREVIAVLSVEGAEMERSASHSSVRLDFCERRKCCESSSRAPDKTHEPKVSTPPALYPAALPRLSIMSISPCFVLRVSFEVYITRRLFAVVRERTLAGHFPYACCCGSIQIAGQIQSPLGNLARTSTLPYLKPKDFAVRILADWIGLMMLTPLESVVSER